MFYAGGVFISFFLGFILLNKKNKSRADIILASWLFFSSVHLLLYYILFTKQYLQWPHLLGLELSLPLAHGPFLYLYVSSLTGNFAKRKKSTLHFLPLILAFLSLVPFFLLPGMEKIQVYQQDGGNYPVLMAVLYGAILLSGISYSVLSLQKLYQHQKNIGDNFSYTEKINLNWLRYLIIGSSITWLVVVVADDEYIYVCLVLYLLFIGYFGIKQVGIFTNKITLPVAENEPEDEMLPGIIDNEEKDVVVPKIKYEKSALTQEQLLSIHTKLLDLMQAEKPFADPELTLNELAEHLQVHPNILSQVINRMEGKNFFDFINMYRVETFKQVALLPENQQYTLLSLAHECGFNSKTSFNRNFKKVTGLSPSEYLKQHHIEML